MLIALLAVECVGRKLPMAALTAFSGAAIMGLTAVHSTALIAVARCGISAAFTVLYVYTPEVTSGTALEKFLQTNTCIKYLHDRSAGTIVRRS